MRGSLPRRAILAGSAAVAATSLAAALLLRKPTPSIYTLDAHADEPETLRGIAALSGVTPVRAAPPVQFQDAQGGVHTLAEFAGRGVVLNFWATWCAPCVRELPSLADLARRAAGTDIVVLPLSLDRGGAAAVQAFYAGRGIQHLGVWTDADGAASRALGVGGVPTTFVIDRQGRIAGLLEGAADWGSAAALAKIEALAAG